MYYCYVEVIGLASCGCGCGFGCCITTDAWSNELLVMGIGGDAAWSEIISDCHHISNHHSPVHNTVCLQHCEAGPIRSEWCVRFVFVSFHYWYWYWYWYLHTIAARVTRHCKHPSPKLFVRQSNPKHRTLFLLIWVLFVKYLLFFIMKVNNKPWLWPNPQISQHGIQT